MSMFIINIPVSINFFFHYLHYKPLAVVLTQLDFEMQLDIHFGLVSGFK